MNSFEIKLHIIFIEIVGNAVCGLGG